MDLLLWMSDEINGFMKRNNNNSQLGSLPSESESSQGGWSRFVDGYLAVVLVLVISLVTWAVAFFTVLQADQHRLLDQRHAHVVSIRNGVQEKLLKHESGLGFGRGLIQSSNYVTRDEWREFFDEQKIGRFFPGVWGYAFIEFVDFDNVDEFVEKVRADNAPEYTVHTHPGVDPSPDGEPKYLVKYHEPASRNRKAWGLDVGARPENRLVYDVSRDTGEMCVSDPITILQGGEQSWGLIFAIAVYDNEMSTDTIEERRKAVRGWVATSLGLNKFFDAEWLSSWDGHDISLYTVDGSIGATDRLVYSSNTELIQQDAESSTIFIPLQVNNLSLVIGVTPRTAPRLLFASSRQSGVLVGGFLLTGLLTMITWSVTRTKFKAIQIARMMTASIRDSEQRQRELASKADEANQAKSAFLANMSHEIRTPMTAILGYSEMLEDNVTEETSDECVESIAAIRRSGTHLMMIINDVLDFSKIESGKMNVDCHPCNPLVIVQEVYEALRITATKKGLDLRVKLGDAVPESVDTDAYRLRQILINLIGNAIKFTEQGRVEIELGVENDQVRFAVRDTGTGISDSEIDSLFNPFEQVDNSVTRRHEGTGLGLAISARLASLIGGDIEVRSLEGVGSTFTLVIPVGYSGIQCSYEVACGDSDDEALSDHPVVSDLLVEIGAAVQSRAENQIENRIEGRVLLAEDGADNRKLISRMLTRVGLRVEMVENGQQAIDTLDGPGVYDIVLMDMQMPVLDGYSATRLLRDMGYTLPIVALTAHAMIGAREECIEAGCSAYVAKPINRDELYAIIRKLMDEGRSGSSGKSAA